MTSNQTDPFQPTGTQAYATPPSPTPPRPTPYPAMPPVPGGPGPGARRERNSIGIVAFIAAVLGLVFAVWEGAYLLGWILLPIAFVLSLVALFQSGKDKKLGIAALILSIVGTVAGVFAFTASAARAIDDAFSGGEVTASAPAGPVGGDAGRVADEGSSVNEIGTRTNPYPLGTAISSENWTVTVNSFDADATDEVLAENSYNDKPASGRTYALANITVTYTGAESGTPMEVRVSYVTSAGNTVETYDAGVVEPDPLDNNTLYNAASATGNVALLIPEGDAGTLRIQPGFLGDAVFVAIR